MNVLRRLSRHQAIVLRGVGRGEMRVFYDDGTLVLAEKVCETWYERQIVSSKPRGPHLVMCGNHQAHAVIELLQRGLLVRSGDHVAMTKDARRAFGSPPAPPVPPRLVVMSRTRAARDQKAAVA